VFDDFDIGPQLRREPAASREAEEIGGIGRLPLHHYLQREARTAPATGQ
jgi:hypothetical protein